MKNKLYISLFAACALGFASCESDIDNYMVDDTVGLLKSGLVEAEVFPGVDASYEIYVIKSGKGFNSATASIVVDPEIITEYNALSSTKQTVSELPADCYSITVSSVTLTNADYRMPFEISWNFDKLQAALADDANLVLPLRVKVDTEGNIAENRLTALIKPTVTNPVIVLEEFGLSRNVLEPTRASHIDEEFNFKVNANFIAQEDIKYNIEVDPTLIDDYNEAHNTKYKLLPEEAYALDKFGTIKKHLKNDIFKLIFKRTGLIPVVGRSKFGDYILPIRLTGAPQLDEEKSYMLYRISVVPVEISKSKWSIVECSSTLEDDPAATEAEKRNHAPSALIDGTTDTFWRSAFSTEQTLPYSVVIDLGQDRDLFKFEGLVPNNRANRMYVNNKAGYVEVSPDNQTWTKVGEWENQLSTQSISCQLQACTARYVKLVITEVYDNPKTVNGVNIHNATALGEITLWGE